MHNATILKNGHLCYVGGSLTESLFVFGRLFQEFCVMAFAKIDTQRLRFFRLNQDQIRADLYSNVVDAVSADTTNNKSVPCGKRVVLPATHVGGPRDMHNRYQDAMALVRKFGKPSFFITMTCNPNWPEIVEACKKANCTTTDRPDIVARVFKLKVDALMKDLTQNHVLGEVAAHLCVIEFQKRGLPHAHILLIMKPGSRINTGKCPKKKELENYVMWTVGTFFDILESEDSFLASI